MAEDAGELVQFWPVIQNMVVQELRVRYQRSMLGFFWTLLNPILMMMTLTLVFSQLLRDQAARLRHLPVRGHGPLGLPQRQPQRMRRSASSQNEGLIRKIYLPKLVFPLSRVLINLMTFVLSLVALFLLLEPLGAAIHPPMLLLPVVIVLFTTFTLGLGLIVATANTFFRDCGHLVAVFLQAWYFATPIIYQVDEFPPASQWRFWLNPAYSFIRMFQVDHPRRALAESDLVLGGRRHRDGEPGDRLCRIQVPRRQAGIPTLTRRGRADAGSPRPTALVELRGRLAPVRQLLRQAVLAQASGRSTWCSAARPRCRPPNSGPCAT